MITRVRLMQTSARLMRNEQSPERVVKLVSCAQRATRLSLFPSHPTVPALPQGVCDKDTGVQPTHFRDPMSFMITLLLHIILAGRACDPRVSIAGVRHTAADCTKMSSGVVAVLRTWAARARSAVDGANATGFAIRGRTARATIGGAPRDAAPGPSPAGPGWPAQGRGPSSHS